MESVHGVDVSWLHSPAASREQHRTHAPSSPGLTRDVPPPISSHGGHAQSQPEPASPLPVDEKAAQPRLSDEAKVTPQGATGASDPAPTTPTPTPATAPAPAPAPTPAANPGNDGQSPKLSRRPSLLRGSSDRQPGSGLSRRNSWISNLSSRFSSQNSPTPTAPQTSKQQVNGVNAGPSAQTAKEQLPSAVQGGRNKEAEELQPYIPQKPRETNGSFFSNLTRRISSSAGAAGQTDVARNGGMCPRKVLNIDKARERCLVPELDLAKLRRVAFSVDVEIAGGPKYTSSSHMTAKQKKARVQRRAEGEALKHPEAVLERKEHHTSTDGSADCAIVGNDPNKAPEDTPETNNEAPPATPDGQQGNATESTAEAISDKQDEAGSQKLQRTKSETNGATPASLATNGAGPQSALAPPAAATAPASNAATPGTSAPASGTATPRGQDRPTTDPVRIYRRCCQLRETPILKRITEQLMAPNCTLPDDPGVVAELQLTGSRLQPADVVTLSDWLAIVPVKRLLMEDADLHDEGIRVVLAGLLAAKKPMPTKRRNGTPVINRAIGGYIERLTIKNNPKITRVGWKYISLFVYMCHSIKALDVSMVAFPHIIPPSIPDTDAKVPARPGFKTTTRKPVDAGETFAKALSERLGGSHLQELTMAECGLEAEQVRKIVDAATVCGVSRLGLAGNQICDEGLEHIMSYIRSGVCQAIDIGSNDLRGKLDRVAEALTHNPNCPVWGLSLAGCNLDCASLKELFPALAALRNFRFIDLSHNRDLFDANACVLPLLRKFVPKLKNLKRIHLADVGMQPKQAISLAEVLPEGPALAHISIEDNPAITKLANSTDEQSQEEACALYASFTAAARVSKSIICIDIDVPCAEHGEVVKALAKQVVAYCLRNMDRTMETAFTGELAAALSKPHGVEDARRVAIPDVLYHLVGDLDHTYRYEGKEGDEPGPDEDYIVGGNGLVKALEYCLGEADKSAKRGSFSLSGMATPTREIPSDHAGNEVRRKGKAKEVSRELLRSARKLRTRLMPALVKEMSGGDEFTYKRLLFLDDTLRGIIERFEDEYPECRLTDPSDPPTASLSSSVESTESGLMSQEAEALAGSIGTFGTDTTNASADSDIDDDLQIATGPTTAGISSRKNSDVSLSSRAMSIEEGRIHRLGHKVRQDIVSLPSAASSPMPIGGSGGASAPPPAEEPWAEGSKMSELNSKLHNMSGPELKEAVDKSGWEGLMQSLGTSIAELRQLQMSDPVGWEQFKESQLKTRANTGAMAGSVGDESAVEMGSSV